MQPARLGQRPTLVNTQGPIRLRHVCYVTVADEGAAVLQTASQPAGIYATVYGPTDRVVACDSQQQKSGPICTHLWKNAIVFVTTTPIDKKTKHMACTWSVR